MAKEVGDRSFKIAKRGLIFAMIPLLMLAFSVLLFLLRISEGAFDVIYFVYYLLIVAFGLLAIYSGIWSLVIREKDSPGRGSAIIAIIFGILEAIIIPWYFGFF